MTDKIDLAVRDVVADLSGASASEFKELITSAVESDHFMYSVLAVLMPSSDPATVRLIFAMSMMLWAGMRIERARHEADVLDRLYGKDLV